MNEILKKIASKENARAGAQLALDLMLGGLDTDEQKAAAKKRLAAFLLSNVETLDDSVALIPGWGPMLRALVDSAPVDAVEAQLCDMLAEVIVQALKGFNS